MIKDAAYCECLMRTFPMKNGYPYHPAAVRKKDKIRESHIGNMLHRYGYFPHLTAWISYLYGTARGVKAALKHNGILWYKIAESPDHRINGRLDQVLRYHREVGFKLISHLTALTGSHQSSCTTHYLIMQLDSVASQNTS